MGRAGTACEECGRGLLTLPVAGVPARGVASARLAGVTERVRGLLPVLRVTSAGVLAVVVVAGAFIVGRSSAGSSASAPAAPPAAVGDPSDETGWRELNWRARGSGLTLTVRHIRVDGVFTYLGIRAEGLEDGESLVGVGGVRVLDGAGRDLLDEGDGDRLRVEIRSRRPGRREPTNGEIVIPRALQHNQVTGVHIGSVTVARPVERRLRGTLLDPGMRPARSERDLAPRDEATCDGCELKVRCEECGDLRLLASSYRHGMVTLVLRQPDASRPDSPRFLGPFEEDVSAQGEGGTRVSVLQDQLPDGTTMVWIPGKVLLFGRDVPPKGEPVPFNVEVDSSVTGVRDGSWTLPGGTG